jgi:hypothetical protein
VNAVDLKIVLGSGISRHRSELSMPHWLPVWGANSGKAITEAPRTANIAKAARDLIIGAAGCG